MNEILKVIEKCTGCDVCKLPCPVWRQTHDAALTFSGRAKALQGGASPEDLYKSLMACVLCGSCEPACPEKIDTLEATLSLRANLTELGFTLFSSVHSFDGIDFGTKEYGKRTFLPNKPIFENKRILKKIETLLGNEYPLTTGGGEWPSISSCLQAGIYPSQEIESEIKKALRQTQEIIVSDGLLIRNLRKWLPKVHIMGLGEAMIRLPVIRHALRKSDLYVIDSTAFHTDYADLISLYDHVRVETGCRMNLDLQRIAIPTGSSCLQEQCDSNQINPSEQTRWITYGLEFKRIVVESLYDLDVFRKITDTPVIHASELM